MAVWQMFHFSFLKFIKTDDYKHLYKVTKKAKAKSV